MAADLRPDPGFPCPPLDLPEGVIPWERLRRQPAGFEIGRAKQRPLFVLIDPRGRNVAVEVLLERVVRLPIPGCRPPRPRVLTTAS